MKLLRKTDHLFFGAVSLFVYIVCFPSFSISREIPAIHKQISNGGYALAKGEKILYSENLNTPFIPASTIKLVTSLAALKILGPKFSFHTKLFVDDTHNLFIQGFGDPFLVSEKVAYLARLVAESGLTAINNIILDDFSFKLDSPPDGSSGSKNSYDVSNSALAVNFNSLALHVYKSARVQSSEPQTPFLPLSRQIGSQLSTGYHRVNVDAFPQQGILTNSLRYTGELFQALLTTQGIKVRGSIKHERVSDKARPLIDFKASETVSELIESCLLSSNNFMANQLYLALGVKRFGFPATWQKSRSVMNDFIAQELGLSPEQLIMIEGSGISSKNRITPKALITVLEHFRPYASLIPMKYGTRMKSGTLRKTGVFCYAGYIPDGKVSRSFVILLNQKRNCRDQILKTLYQL